ncbi:hypothetical protein SAMN04489712_10137 [Thermomonospora echinospora]|uniref:Uncharacterized protein n=1 Tax=Thermomonospora echinospora TaxID=1992 RepID=A0A1H5S1E5_9ACTN|nr:hypothetical protein [Thermomonospora echinospora]SEF44300.1 hypothetical protein SAMN04489712_10137 [Thermomonospora echinospora]
MGGASGPEPQYLVTAPGPVRYVEVTYRGEVIGCLWASVKYDAAGYVRRLEAEPPEAFRAPLVWSRRLRAAKAEGLPALEALRRWRGAPEDPEGGTVVADAPERDADSYDALKKQLNPGHVDPMADFFAQTPTWPDGTPIDRSKGWDPLSPMKIPETDYPASTDGPVRYLPVTRGDTLLGYLWASAADDAAYYVGRTDAGADGWNAGVPWVLRLRRAQREGLTPLQALRRWKGAPEDPRAGTIAVDAHEQEASSLDDLKRLAQR